MRGKRVTGTAIDSGPEKAEFKVASRPEAQLLPMDERLGRERLTELPQMLQGNAGCIPVSTYPLECLTRELAKKELHAYRSEPPKNAR